LDSPVEERWGIVLKDGTLLPGFTTDDAAYEYIAKHNLQWAVVRALGRDNKPLPLCTSVWKPEAERLTEPGSGNNSTDIGQS